MRTVSTKLHYKAQFHIGSDEKRSEQTFDEVLALLYEYLANIAGSDYSFDQYKAQKGFVSENKNTRFKVALMPETPQSAMVLLAVKISEKDNRILRRTWETHINAELEKGSKSVILRYALFYKDYTYNSMTEFPPPELYTPLLVKNLAEDSLLQCRVGEYKLPYTAIPLTSQSANVFFDLLFDQKRELPIVVITCPDIVDADEVAEATIGNAIVFFSDDYFFLEEVNGTLPEKLKIAFDAIHTYQIAKVGNTYSYIIQSKTLALYENRSIANVMRHAFCECMSNQQQYRFFTVDEIEEMAEFQKSIAVAKENDALTKQNKRLAKEVDELSAANETLTARNIELEKIAGSDPYADAMEYNEQWTLAEKKIEKMDQQLEKIASDLYESRIPTLDEKPETVAIGCLVQALRHSSDQMIKNGRKTIEMSVCAK